MQNIIFFLLLLPIALIGQVDSVTIRQDGDFYRVVRHMASGQEIVSPRMSAEAIRSQVAANIISTQDQFYDAAGVAYFSNARANVLKTAALVDNSLGTSGALYADMRIALQELHGYYKYNTLYFQLLPTGQLQQVNQSGKVVQGGFTGTWFSDSRYHLVFLSTKSALDNLDFVFDPFSSNTFRTPDRTHTITKVK